MSRHPGVKYSIFTGLSKGFLISLLGETLAVPPIIMVCHAGIPLRGNNHFDLIIGIRAPRLTESTNSNLERRSTTVLFQNRGTL